MNSFLNFDKMLTPVLIKALFWIGTGISVLSGLGMIVTGAGEFGGGFIQFMGLVLILVGPVLTRIYCELLIVLFKMQESLHKISVNTDAKTKVS